MKLRHSFLIFLIGLLVGIGISPLAEVKLQQAFISPVPVILAEENKNPDPSNASGFGVVLGVKTKSQSEIKQEAMMALIDQQDQEFSQVKEEVEIVSVSDSKEKIDQSLISSKTATIAIYGDSMVDTMGTGLPYLETSLRNYYPQVNFKLLNYGIGAQTVEQGLAGFDQNYNYKDRQYDSITNSGADIIIIESFAYNPLGEEGLDTQWIALSQMVEKARATGAQVMLLATIAPTKTDFGQGPGGVNWPADIAWQHAETINRYLENTVKLASSLNVPLIDAYHASLLSNGEGNPSFINNHDHIHPSVAGHQFVAGLIAETISRRGMIK